MARAFTQGFYTSPEWKAARAAYIKKSRGLCERCLSFGLYTPGKVVHHKVHLSPENINDPDVTLNPDNFMLLCQDCHAAVHLTEKTFDRFYIDKDGNVLTK